MKNNSKVLIICKSIHHKNTLKIAKTISEKLNAIIKSPEEVNNKDINDFEIIGFGSGIYNGKHHISLFKLIDKLNFQRNKKAFIFSTASIRYKKMHKDLKDKLNNKGFIILDEFICKGFMSYSFIKYIFGGINKNRPNEKDILKAKKFAEKIKTLR
ncbi:MAG: flavodoxin family protein [Bacillota bacterium]